MANLFSSRGITPYDRPRLRNRITQPHCPFAARMYSELQSECRDLDLAVSSLASCLDSSLRSFISSTTTITSSSLVYLNSLSLWLQSITHKSSNADESLSKKEEVMSFHVYREAGMKLIMLIGEIEDYASSDEGKRMITRLKQEAINTLALVVCSFSEISKASPEWRCFVNAIDERLGKTFAVIKPHAVAKIRNLLTSLDVSFSNHFLFETKLGLQYHQMITSFCQFQRAHTVTNINCPHSQLWVIEELANHLFPSCREHFLQWRDEPNLIFDQSFKICQDYVPFLDKTLQPIVDEAELREHNCIGEWVSFWITEFSTFIEEDLLPLYQDRNFIKLVELMVHFDKKIRLLLRPFSLRRNLRRFSSFSVLLNQPEFIELWAEIESEEPIKAVYSLISKEKTWEDVNLNVCSESMEVLKLAVDRGKVLPTNKAKRKFLTLVGVPIIEAFVEGAYVRFHKAEALGVEKEIIEKCNTINMMSVFEWSLRKKYKGNCLKKPIKDLKKNRKMWIEMLRSRIFTFVEPLTIEGLEDVVKENLNIRDLEWFQELDML